MFDKRLSVLKENSPGLFAGNKSICFINPRDLTDLAHFKIRNTVVFTDDIRMYSPLSIFGYNCEPEANLVVDISIVLLPKSKELARELVFMGFMMSPEGFVVIDGDKKDGIVSIIKELEEEICYEVNLSKAHGKIAVFRPGNGNLPLNWHASKSNKVNNEFITVPGVFSADHIDPASELLKKYLPNNLKGSGADFGVGWGFLTKYLENLDTVDNIYAIDVSKRALTCAAKNCVTSKVQFIWNDVLKWKSPELLNFIVMNPPFHTHGKIDIALGEKFIISAANNLVKNGSLHMVSNRHLPYENIISKHFKEWKEIGGNNKFKVILAEKPLAVSKKNP